MFKIIHNKGFHMTFPNGWTVSVQFGPGNYCDNYGEPIIGSGDKPQGSSTAEIAAWDSSTTWYEFESGDTVAGYKSPTEVLEFINKIAALPANAEAEPNEQS